MTFLFKMRGCSEYYSPVIFFDFKEKYVDFKNLEERINKKYRCQTNINKNRIILSFSSEEDLNKFIKKINK